MRIKILTKKSKVLMLKINLLKATKDSLILKKKNYDQKIWKKNILNNTFQVKMHILKILMVWTIIIIFTHRIKLNIKKCQIITKKCYQVLKINNLFNINY